VVLVDTSVWVDFFRGVPSPQAAWLDRHLGTEAIVIGDLILAEVLQGFRDDRAFNEARRLRALGVTVRGTVDLVIATRCIADGLVLLHDDRDFRGFAEHLGLRVVDCAA